MRIISLVPNATEIVFALGAGDQLVGVSHECDYPPAARHLPQLTGSALPAVFSGRDIDAAVSAQLADGSSLYTLAEERIAALRPDLILTQTLCPVCAVSTDQVADAVEPLTECPTVLSLDPKRLRDVLADIVSVGRALGRDSEAGALVTALEARMQVVRTAARAPEPPRVVALEWLDPPFIAGHWIPEMIAAAGGSDAGAYPGDTSRRTDWKSLELIDPDVVVAMPCGYDESGAQAELHKLARYPGLARLRAAREGRIYAVDANGLFSRPGPRLVDGIEKLAEVLFPTGEEI